MNYIERVTTKLYDGHHFKGAIEDFTKAIEMNAMNCYPFLYRVRSKDQGL